jgi:hypothetical protein
MNKIAIIGTAGRDKTKPMTRLLWDWMVEDATRRIPKGAHLVSGGAAWADHLAVELFRIEHAAKLTLHLPAPLGIQGFNGPSKSAATAANYYHSLFGQVIGRNTVKDIIQSVACSECNYTTEPEAPGYGAMFARNAKVARTADELLAYTFGPGGVPADGGTKNTWDQFAQLHRSYVRTHVSLPILS